MGTKAKDVLTPANAVTTAGFLLTIYGAVTLNTVLGVWCVVFGRLFDIFDGYIARRTHTSDLGAIYDATTDKLAGLALLIASWYYNSAPKIVILFIFLLHLGISLINGYAILHKRLPHSSKDGKHTMFLQMISLISFATGHVLNYSFWYILAWLTLLISVPLSVKTLHGYYRYSTKNSLN